MEGSFQFSQLLCSCFLTEHVVETFYSQIREKGTQLMAKLRTIFGIIMTIAWCADIYFHRDSQNIGLKTNLVWLSFLPGNQSYISI